jgi:hypothetical protein
VRGSLRKKRVCFAFRPFDVSETTNVPLHMERESIWKCRAVLLEVFFSKIKKICLTLDFSKIAQTKDKSVIEFSRVPDLS